MPYTIIVFACRKPGLSPTEFKSHCEFTHVPLLQSIAGDLFPRSYTRRYIQRGEGVIGADGNDNANRYPATVLVGAQADFEYDAFAELIFDNETAFQAFFARVSEAKAAERIGRDEDMFLDRARMKVAVVDDCQVTTGPETARTG